MRILLSVIVLHWLPPIVSPLSLVSVVEVALALTLDLVRNRAEVACVLLGKLIHCVHIVAVDRVVGILNLVLYHHSPLRRPLWMPRVGIQLLQLLLVHRAVLLGEVLGMRFYDLAGLFVD